MHIVSFRAACTCIVAAAMAAVPAIAIASTNDDALAIALASSSEPVEQTLSPDQAFRPKVKQVGHNVELQFAIADGYHLYRDKIRIETNPTGSLGEPVFPAAEERVDRVLGRQKVFSRDAIVRLTVADGAPKQFKMTVRYQGCAGVGVCYPPQTAFFTVKGTPSPSPVKAVSSGSSPASAMPTASLATEPMTSPPKPDQALTPAEETTTSPGRAVQDGRRGLVPSWLAMVVVAVIAIIVSVFLNAFEPLRPDAGNRHRFAKGFGLLLFLFGAAQMVGVFAGGRSLLAPLPWH